MSNPKINETCFFRTRNDFDREWQNITGTLQKHMSIIGNAQCLRRGNSDIFCWESLQTLSEHS